VEITQILQRLSLFLDEPASLCSAHSPITRSTDMKYLHYFSGGNSQKKALDVQNLLDLLSSRGEIETKFAAHHMILEAVSGKPRAEDIHPLDGEAGCPPFLFKAGRFS